MQSDSTQSTYLNSLSDLRTYVDTARNLSSSFPIEMFASSVSPEDSCEDSTESVARKNGFYSEEELIRRRTVVLTAFSPCSSVSLSDTISSRLNLTGIQVGIWMGCIAAGSLRDASLIMSRHLITPLSSSHEETEGLRNVGRSLLDGRDEGSVLSHRRLMAALKSIPDSVTPSEVVAWVKIDVLPHLFVLDKDQPDKEPTTGGRVDTSSAASTAAELSNELCRRARLSAELLGHPFEALPAAELAVLFASSTSTSAPNHGAASNLTSTRGSREDASQDLLKNLQIQAAIWRYWGDRNRPTLSDVAELSLCGLVWERLWTLVDSDCVISEDINEVIEPLVKEFGGDLDDVLESWIQDTIEQRVILVGNSPSKEGRLSGGNQGEEDKEMTCSLSRLVSVVALIRSPQRRVGSLLLLFQVSGVDRSEDSSVKQDLSLHGVEDHSLGGEGYASGQQYDPNTADRGADSTGRNKDTKSTESSSAITVTRLCQLAQAACSLVEPAAAEALTEAIRSQRIKTLAGSYGVISFDPRDRHQIRAAANVIAMKSSPHALRDAIEFASSWGSDSANLSGLLTRAVVNRSTKMSLDTDSADEGTSREQAIRDALAQVPPHMLLAVVEDSCTYLIETLEDICEDALSAGMLI